MIIQHNLHAMNAERMLNVTTSKRAGSSEKLSSGYRINRAADDAAGLSISEKMRRLVRGLDQGSENIQDGISLCQVADGALAEVTSVLQRVRELSIQAYNGTNSKSDRNIIQNEVDSCLEGIDEIKERTKFNELYLLRGDQSVCEDRLVPVEETYMAVKTDAEYRRIPDWLIINDGRDNEIKPRDDYKSDFSTDTSDIMYADYQFKLKDENGKETEKTVSVYYGARKADSLKVHGKDYIYINAFAEQFKDDSDLYDQYFNDGQNSRLKDYVDNILNNGSAGWTPDNTDNPSCKLDFGGLQDKTNTADDLYKNMFNLLGCEIGVPCGTCSNVNAVQFSGSIDGWKVNEFITQINYQSKALLSLSENTFKWKQFAQDGSVAKNDYTYTEYFDAISGLFTISDETTRNAKAKELANDIAADLKERMEKLLSSEMQEHFDRVTSDNDAAKDKVLYIYDYRDKDALLAPADADSIVLNLVSCVNRTMTYEAKRTCYAEAEKNRTYGIKIHGSANSYDSIPLLLQEISRDSLNLNDYSVNRYSLKITYQHDRYKKELEAWYEAMKNCPYKIETETIYPTICKELPKYEMRAVNGEWKQFCISPGVYEPGEPIQVQKRVLIGAPPRPTLKSTAEEYYNPSPLALIDEAIATVSALRSYFGANQNRLEHAFANNENTAENLQAAESRIRDTDMAKESVNYSLQSILDQAGQAMIVQANQINQGVLNLLQ